MKIKLLCLVTAFSSINASSQSALSPDKIYGVLFHDVQMARIFPDGKTFVDCIPKKDPAAIVDDYKKLKNNPAVRYSLQRFVEANFDLPVNPADNYKSNTNEDAATHIKNLWPVLKREADKPVAGSSLLPLPYSYIVPGGRFREIYYWDSYFTMLGLEESGEYEIMENMVRNFAYLIDTYGHIPNGNRTYYLSRSQPPYFALMVELLAKTKGDSIYKTFLGPLKKEYAFWMNGAEKLKNGGVYKRVVKLNDGTIMNRYCDDANTPRPEGYKEDVETAARQSKRSKEIIYKNLRSGAESGIDFSSRWFSDRKNLTTIQVIDMIPVDLNCLLYQLETTISRASLINNDQQTSDSFKAKAQKRKAAILKYCWDNKLHFFTDYNFKTHSSNAILTPLGLFPLFVEIASSAQADHVARLTASQLLKAGGITTSNYRTGEQWDAPNGWPPLQWLVIKGLENYNKKDLAADIAGRWMALNEKVFKATGKMMEKYNVMDMNVDAGGGEYPSQDGFGWTNGVYLKLLGMYRGKNK